MLQCVDGFTNELNLQIVTSLLTHTLEYTNLMSKSTTRLSLDRTEADTYETAQ